MKKHTALKQAIEDALYGETGFYTQLRAYIQAYNKLPQHTLPSLEVSNQVLANIVILSCGAVSEVPQHRFLQHLTQELAQFPQVVHKNLLASVYRLNHLLNDRLLKNSLVRDSGLHNQFIKQIEVLKSRTDLKSMFRFINDICVVYTVTDSFDHPDEEFRARLETLLNGRNRKDPLPLLEQVCEKSFSPLSKSFRSFSSLSTISDVTDHDAISPQRMRDSQPNSPSVASLSDHSHLFERIAELEAENQRLKAAALSGSAVLPEASAAASVNVPAAETTISIKDLLDLYRLEEGFVPIAHFDDKGDFTMASDRLRKILTALDPQDLALSYQEIKTTNFEVVNYLMNLNNILNRYAAANNQILFISKFKKLFQQWQEAYAAQLQAYLQRKPKNTVEVIAPAPVAITLASPAAIDTSLEKRRNVQHVLELFLEPSFLGPHLAMEAKKTIADKEAYIAANDVEAYATMPRDPNSFAMAAFDANGQFFIDVERLYQAIDRLHLKPEDEAKKMWFKACVAELQVNFEKDADIAEYLNKLVKAVRTMIGVYVASHDENLRFNTAMRVARSAWDTKHDALLVEHAQKYPKVVTKMSASTPSKLSFSASHRKALEVVERPLADDPAQAALKSKVKNLYQSLTIEFGVLTVDKAILFEQLTTLNQEISVHEMAVESVIQQVSQAVTNLEKIIQFKKSLHDMMENHPVPVARYLAEEYDFWVQQHRVVLVVSGLSHLALANRLVKDTADAAKIHLLKPYMKLLEEVASDAACIKLFNDFAQALSLLTPSSDTAKIRCMQQMLYQGFDSNISFNGTQQKWEKKAAFKKEFNTGFDTFMPDKKIIKQLIASAHPQQVPEETVSLPSMSAKSHVRPAVVHLSSAQLDAMMKTHLQSVEVLLACFSFNKGHRKLHEKALIKKISEMDSLQSETDISTAFAAAVTLIEKITVFKRIMANVIAQQSSPSSLGAIFDKKYKAWVQAHHIELAVDGLCHIALNHGFSATSPLEKEAILKRYVGEFLHAVKCPPLTVYDELQIKLRAIHQDDTGAVISCVAETIDSILKKDKMLDKKSKIAMRAAFKTAFAQDQTAHITPVYATGHPESSTEKNDQLPHDVAHEVDGHALHELKPVLTVQEYLALISEK